MTVPRNSWIRSRSPSLIRRWTLTVSPGRSSGIWGLTAASTALLLSLIGTTWHVFSVQPPPHTLGRRNRSLPRPAGRRLEPAEVGAGRSSSTSDLHVRAPGIPTCTWQLRCQRRCKCRSPFGFAHIVPVSLREGLLGMTSLRGLVAIQATPHLSFRGPSQGRAEESPEPSLRDLPTRQQTPRFLAQGQRLQPRPRQIQRRQRFGVPHFAGGDQRRHLSRPDPLDSDLLVAVGGKGRRRQAGGPGE